MKRFAMIACTFTFLAGCTDSGLHESDSPIDNNNVSVRMACGYNLCPEDLGKYCDSNSDCTNRQCVNHACRYESNATVGDHSSEHASDSESGGEADPGGGSGGGADSSSAHGSSSSEGLSASNLWVEGGSLPSGSACESHQACESGLCYQGRCSDDCELLGCSDSNMVCRYGRCIPISTDGGECSFKPIEADELGYKYNHFTGGGIIGS